MSKRSGSMLREARRAAGLTQAELEARSGVPKSAISMYETGVRQPRADAFLRLLDATGSRVAVSRFSDEHLRRGRVFSDLLRFAVELPHSWPGDNIRFPVEVWRNSTDVGSVMGSDVGDKLIAVHEALDTAGIEHAFGGAVALAYAVPEPRSTIDIDINVAVPLDQADRVIAALPEGVVARPDVLERIAADGQDRLRWGDVPVDLFFPQHRFHSVVARRTVSEPFRNTVIQVITPTDLTVFKALFNRRKDWADIESMLRAGVVDEAEAIRWTQTIVGADHPSHVELIELIDEVRSSPEHADWDPNVWRPRP